MLTVTTHLTSRRPDNHALRSGPEEQRSAEAQGITVEVYRLQERLRKLPLVPRKDWLRKKRAELVDKLFVTARRDRCLSHVNPWAASDSNIPPIPH
jgi:hypothetical protein